MVCECIDKLTPRQVTIVHAVLITSALTLLVIGILGASRVIPMPTVAADCLSTFGGLILGAYVIVALSKLFVKKN